MEGKAVIIFFGFIACAFAVYPVKKACEIECSSHLDCQTGYSCQTVGCNRLCRPKRVILSNAVVRSDIITSGCVERCLVQGGQDCRRLCQRDVDSFPGGQIITGDSLDSTLTGALVDSIRSGSLVRRISPVDSIRSDSLVRRISPVDSIRSGSLVRRILPVDSIGCKNTCISRGCNFNEECVTRNGCSVCVLAKTYA
ncbi:uncharacterized protein LOC127704512 isoform X1 [Mytilus californianus]|uniref:uncharacterized protein LOC127704512 isoform X1 n=1 Tax=Mytilus californianus TaxID=6549 RepID=UPI002245F5A4|nr:uncharacterized protein LOC127704512 isoform X1 [Mytilus californianus]XP_052064574.1 uncharacterized protein LOC127704512 isoform X2 [Mytilus californianus]XP_052064582.1 uncharacterized protein LOC127704512 isoform X1 [Mytilus californianus]